MFTVCISFAGITVKFRFPTPVDIPEELSAFRCEDVLNPDAVYEIRLISEPLLITGQPVAVESGAAIYSINEGWLRVYLPLVEADGCQVACFFSPCGQNVLYYPAAKWSFYKSPLRLLHLLWGEALLLRHDALLLHSSVVLTEGRTILFCGPSGAGKSTQAALWQQHKGAQILNGDRCVLRRREGKIYGCGSPWSGTSHIYHTEQAPVGAIFLVTQSQENRVEPPGLSVFSSLLSQITVNSWDTVFMREITALLGALVEQVPIYRLHCRPDAEAVKLAFETAFGRE